MVRLQALTPLSEGELILSKTNQITVPPSPLPPRSRGQWSSLLSIVVEFVQRMRYFPAFATRQDTIGGNNIRHSFRFMFGRSLLTRFGNGGNILLVGTSI